MSQQCIMPAGSFIRLVSLAKLTHDFHGEYVIKFVTFLEELHHNQ
jgi:hypothetical protein